MRVGLPFATFMLSINGETSAEGGKAEIAGSDESGRVSRLESTLGRVNQALVRLRSREEMLERVCDAMVEYGGYIISWMGWLNPRTHIVVPAVFSGQVAEEYLSAMRITVDEDALGKGPTGSALREGKTFVCNDFQSDERTRPWWDAGKVAGIRSSAAFPFRSKGVVCGTLNVYSNEPKVFGEKEVSILEEIAVDISVALDRIDEEMLRAQSVKTHAEGEERFRGFAEAAEQVFWISSLHPELILYVNPAFERLWGRPVSDLYRNPRIWTDSIYIDDRARVTEGYSNWTLGIPGSRYDVEYRLVKPDGDIRWIADHGFVLRSEGNRILQVGGIAEDITDRKEALAKLQRSEKRYRQALDNMMEGCMIIGFDWTYLYVNDAAARHGRQSKEKLIGHTMMEMYPGVEESEVFARYRDCMLESIPQKFESKFVFLDGTTNWYEFIVNPVPEGIFVLSLDITDRKRVLEALMESEETLREAQSLARLGNWRFDLLTNKFTCSDELLRILELSPDEFGDTFEEFLCMIHIDDRAYVVSVYKKSIEDRVSTHVSHRVLLRNGSIKSVVQQFTTFYDSSGRPVRSVGTVQDVTSREGTWER